MKEHGHLHVPSPLVPVSHRRLSQDQFSTAMHRPLLIASLAGSVLGGALPGLEDGDASPDTIVISSIETRVITASAACDDEDCGIDSTLTTTATSLATNSVVTTQTAYATAVRTSGGEDDESSPQSSPIPEEHSEPSGTPSASASPSNGQPVASPVSSSVAPDWPTLVPAVPGNQPKDSLDSLTPTNSSTLTFTLDGDSDPSTEHLFAELTANHTTPGLVLEHSAQIVDVSCADAQGAGLKVDLSTQAAVDFARAAWDENFIAITSSAACGRLSDSGHHSYWNVTAVSYPADKLTALLDAVEIDVHDFLDHVHLVWGTHVPHSSAAAAHVASASSKSGAGASPTDLDDDDDNDPDYDDSDSDSDSDYDYDSDDDEGAYLGSDAEFARELQRFAPGLSTYASEDYEEDDSPAAVTGIGSDDDDYDIEDSGVIDPDQGDQLPAEAFQKRHERRRQPARADDRDKLPSYKPVMLGYYGGGSDRSKLHRFWWTEEEREQEKERKKVAKMTSDVERKDYQDARRRWEENRERAQDASREVNRLRRLRGADKTNKKLEQELKTARATSSERWENQRHLFSMMNILEKLALEAPQKKKAAQSAQNSPRKRAPSADKIGRADSLAIQGDQLPAGAVEKRQDLKHGYENQPDLFGYDKPPGWKPPPRSASSSAYEREQKSQKAKLADQTSVVEDKGYTAAKANQKEAAQRVQIARANYWHAVRAARRKPDDQELAQELEQAEAALAILNKNLRQATRIVRQLGKSARRAAKEKQAANSVQQNTARRKRAASASADKSSRADPLAVADQVAKDTLDHVKANPQLYGQAKATAGGLLGFLRNAYDQLAQAVSDVVSKFSTVKLDYPIPFNFSLAERPVPGWSVVEDSPWGEQVLMGSGSKDLGSGRAEVSYNLYCVDCAFTALIHIAGEISFSVSERKLTKGSITVEGSNMVAKLFLGLEGFYQDTYNYEDYILEQAIPPGFSIPKIITMGPAIRYGVRARLDLEAEGMILAGAEVHFSNFNATFDLVDDSKRSFAGLEPTYEPVIEAYGAIRAGFRLGYPYTLGITMHLPMLKKDTGVTITNEPYFKAEASYGDDKNCSKGIAYQTYVGNDVYANLLNLAKVTISKLKGPPIHSGCEK